jgi:phosphatidylglycerophosphatase A
MSERFILFLASAGYSGYSPYAPGTAGTFLGVMLYLFLHLFSPFLYLLSTAGVFFLAVWASGKAEVIWQERDSPKIVIDEVVGFLITMTFLPCTLTTVAEGFLFFRTFDIMKPYPMAWIDRRMKGGWAIVLDDAVAGIYANIILQTVYRWHPRLLSFLDGWI